MKTVNTDMGNTFCFTPGASIRMGQMSDAELIGMAAAVMDELKRRWEKRKASTETVTVGQDARAGAIVRFEDGTPVDRPAWFYLPFLPGLSKYFQPSRVGSVSVYREPLPEGKVLVITKGPKVVARVRIGGDRKKVEVGGALIEGRLTPLPERSPAVLGLDQPCARDFANGRR
jgi:hypothetical protein